MTVNKPHNLRKKRFRIFSKGILLQRRKSSSGMWRRVAPGRTHIFEDSIASVISVERISELGTTLAESSNRRALQKIPQISNRTMFTPSGCLDFQYLNSDNFALVMGYTLSCPSARTTPASLTLTRAYAPASIVRGRHPWITHSG
jgi:hypothetical protein